MITTYTPPKTWAYKESLSSADMNLYVRDNVIALKEQIGGIGSLMFQAYEGTPDGPFLACDGSAVSRTTYAALYALLGTTWGVGDGSTTFNLPDARGRVPMGAGTGSGLTARTVGQSGGEETHLLTTAEMPAHTHIQDSHVHGAFVQWGTSDGQNRRPETGSGNYVGTGATQANTNSTTATNQNEGGGGSHNNIQPYYVVKTFVRYA